MAGIWLNAWKEHIWNNLPNWLRHVAKIIKSQAWAGLLMIECQM